MTRTRLDAQLQKIRMAILQLGTLVETALSHALQAIQSGDQALCDQVIATDPTIDNHRSCVDHLVLQSLILQQPLGSRDLRFLSSALSITADLERTADNAKGIAKILIRLAPLSTTNTPQDALALSQTANHVQKSSSNHSVPGDSIVSAMVDLGLEAVRVLRGTMDAFARGDAQAARIIWQEDDVVDVRYHMVRHDVMTMFAGMCAIPALQQDECIMQRMTYWLWIAHNLELIGDHCTNICERIVFFLLGDTAMRHDEAI